MLEYYCKPIEPPISLNSELKEMIYSAENADPELLADAMCEGWHIQIFSNGICPTVTITPSADIEQYFVRSGISGYGGCTYVESVRQTMEMIVGRRVYIHKHLLEFTRSGLSFTYSYNESNDYLGFRSSVAHPLFPLLCYKEWTTEEVLYKACELIYIITGDSSEVRRISCVHDFNTYIRNKNQVEPSDKIDKEEFFMLLENHSQIEGEELLFEN